MTRFRIAFVLALGSLPFIAQAAVAQTIDWNNSFIYSSGTNGAQKNLNVTLVGHQNGVADSTHRVLVHLRDSDNQPLANYVVFFANQNAYGSRSSRRLCDGPQSNTTFESCIGGTGDVYVYTDANGDAELRIEGASDGSEQGQGDTGLGTYHEAGVILVKPSFYGAPEDVFEVPIAVLDLDGAGGVGAGDLSLFYQDLWDFGTHSRYRCDYNFDGTVGAADLSFLMSMIFAGRSNVSCQSSSYCP